MYFHQSYAEHAVSAPSYLDSLVVQFQLSCGGILSLNALHTVFFAPEKIFVAYVPLGFLGMIICAMTFMSASSLKKAMLLCPSPVGVETTDCVPAK
jgi:hypothetical protein